MIKSIPGELLTALRLTLVVAVLTGLVYPLAITGVSQALFNHQANGSLVTNGSGAVVGSSLLGQQFVDPKYFHGRPSATLNQADATKAAPYNAQNSGGSNLAPSNQALTDRVKKDVAAIQATDTVPAGGVPVDLVTTSFSGLDPNITEAAALIQVDRVAKIRNLDATKLRTYVQDHVQGRTLGIFGEPRVNVLSLNLALDSGAGK